MLPNFLIIGAQKSGTTTLWNACNAHPDVFMAPARETGFFFNDATFNNGVAFYETAFFRDWNGEKAVGEKTPEYLLFPETAERIRAVLGSDIRLIVLLRNPAQRAHSGWRHNLMMGWESLPFRAALAAEPERIATNRFALGRFGYLARGYYARQLKRYFDVFSADRIKIIFFDDVLSRQEDVIRDVYRFVGVADDLPVQEFNEGKPVLASMSLSGSGSSRMVDFRGSIVRMPSKQLERFAEQYNNTLDTMKALDPEEAGAINRDVFGDDIAALEILTGRRLDAWLGK